MNDPAGFAATGTLFPGAGWAPKVNWSPSTLLLPFNTAPTMVILTDAGVPIVRDQGVPLVTDTVIGQQPVVHGTPGAFKFNDKKNSGLFHIIMGM